MPPICSLSGAVHGSVPGGFNIESSFNPTKSGCRFLKLFSTMQLLQTTIFETAIGGQILVETTLFPFLYKATHTTLFETAIGGQISVETTLFLFLYKAIHTRTYINLRKMIHFIDLRMREWRRRKWIRSFQLNQSILHHPFCRDLLSLLQKGC